MHDNGIWVNYANCGMQKTNVAQMRVSEEGQFFMNVYFCSSHAFVKLVPSSHQEVVFYSGLFYDSIIHGTYLWPFPVSSVINTVLKLIVEKEGDEDVVCPQHLCKSRLQVHVQIHPTFPCHRTLFTFVYILPPRFHPSKESEISLEGLAMHVWLAEHLSWQCSRQPTIN